MLVFSLLSQRFCTALGSLAASGWVTNQPQRETCLRNRGGISLAGIHPRRHLYLCGPFICAKEHLFLFPEELRLESARVSSNPHPQMPTVPSWLCPVSV